MSFFKFKSLVLFIKNILFRLRDTDISQEKMRSWSLAFLYYANEESDGVINISTETEILSQEYL